MAEWAAIDSATDLLSGAVERPVEGGKKLESRWSEDLGLSRRDLAWEDVVRAVGEWWSASAIKSRCYREEGNEMDLETDQGSGRL